MVSMHEAEDLEYARKLQEEYDRESAQIADADENGLQDNVSRNVVQNRVSAGGILSPSAIAMGKGLSPVDPSLEFSDPNPDIRELFLMFNVQYFWGRLDGIEVKWSPRMTLCAGLCVYEGRGGLCSVRLSLPLLKLRPRKDLVETLLHEMIHAYLFVTDNDRDHDGHGPQFQGHMRRINKSTGANISVYHTFHDEVASYQQHWWRCSGPCQQRRPYYGYVKRAMNRAPSARDPWWAQHQATCGGTYTKIKEPEGYGKKKSGKGIPKEDKQNDKLRDIRAFVGKGKLLGTGSNHGHKTEKVNNPASILNVKNTNGSQLELKNPTANGSKQSVIVNGVLLRKGTSSGSSPLFTASSTKTSKNIHYTVDSSPPSKGDGTSSPAHSTKYSDAASEFEKNINKSSSKEFFESSSSSTDNISGKYSGKDRKESSNNFDEWPDEDDSWMLDVDITNPVCGFDSNTRSQSSQKPANCDTIDLTACDKGSPKTLLAVPHKSVREDGVRSGPREKFDPKTKRKNIFTRSGKGKGAVPKGKIRKGIFSKNFVSVCEGGDYTNIMTKPPPEKKKMYVFDELDSNDGLWDEKSDFGVNNSSCNGDQGTSAIIPHRKALENTSNFQSSAIKVDNLTDYLCTSNSQRTGGKSLPSVNHFQSTTKQHSYLVDEAKGKDGADGSLSFEKSERNYNVIVNANEKVTPTNNSVLTHSQIDKSGNFTGQGFILGSGEGGTSFLSQIHKTFHRQSDSVDDCKLRNSRPDNIGEADLGVTGRKRSSEIAFGHHISNSSQNEGLTRKKQNDHRQNITHEHRNSIQEVPYSVLNENTNRETLDLNTGASDLVPCPVCSKSVQSSEINQHLDLCLMTS